ncbi:MAG: hypothetical protein ACE5NC_01630 [Anaerolineae bacterium]
MIARFTVDLLHPGELARTWTDWFLSAQGPRRLTHFASGALGVLLLVALGGILPTSWRLSGDLQKVKGLKRELAATAEDLQVLRPQLQALSAEARRQVPWSELLTTFSRQLPPTLRLQRVELAKPVPAPNSRRKQKEPSPSSKVALQVEAVTPLRPGGPPLLDVARFMAGLMRDPPVNRRFELESWEIKPQAGSAREGPELLQVRITLTERSK